MSNNNNIAVILILFSFLTLPWSGCERAFSNEQEIYSWLSNPKNGLVKTRNVNGIKMTVKYLPPEFLAYKELKNYPMNDDCAKDSLLSLYRNSRTFLLTIGIDEDAEKLDIMKLGVADYSEYKERAMTMNFEMAEYVSLKTEFGELKPVLSNLENVYGLSASRNIYLVFAPNDEGKKLLTAKELDLVFNDEIFNTGINHFTFSKKDMEGFPLINFKK